VEGAVGALPTIAVPGPPAPPQQAEEKDKPWYEDALDTAGHAASWTGQLLGAGKGVGEGVVGIGKGGVELYRLSSFNQAFNPDDYDQAQQQFDDSTSFAWHYPGDFGKAVINWDDLSHGRYGEWAGNLAPDAALAFFTAGAGTAATRGLRGAETVGEVGDAARTADRLGEAARGAERAGTAGTAGGAARIPADAMTDAGRAATARGDHVVRHWTPLDSDRPLPRVNWATPSARRPTTRSSSATPRCSSGSTPTRRRRSGPSGPARRATARSSRSLTTRCSPSGATAPRTP
jgi:hypothetical protein